MDCCAYFCISCHPSQKWPLYAEKCCLLRKKGNKAAERESQKRGAGSNGKTCMLNNNTNRPRGNFLLKRGRECIYIYIYVWFPFGENKASAKKKRKIPVRFLTFSNYAFHCNCTLLFRRVGGLNRFWPARRTCDLHSLRLLRQIQKWEKKGDWTQLSGVAGTHVSSSPNSSFTPSKANANCFSCIAHEIKNGSTSKFSINRSL